MKRIVVVFFAATAILVGACRQEVPYTPMKLGAGEGSSRSTAH